MEQRPIFRSADGKTEVVELPVGTIKLIQHDDGPHTELQFSPEAAAYYDIVWTERDGRPLLSLIPKGE